MEIKTIEQMNEITADVRSTFGMLAPEQLNWKPSETEWSVAQCLDHLIKTNSEMLPAIDAKIAGAPNTFWEKWSPLTGYFGRFLVNSLPVDKKKFKVPSKSIAPPSSIPGDIVDRFADNQSVVIEKIVALDGLDWERIVVTSPFMGLMTYRLSDGITILVEHEKRHVRQAKRVMEREGFSMATAVV